MSLPYMVNMMYKNTEKIAILQTAIAVYHIS